jgi:hypothetical protein
MGQTMTPTGNDVRAYPLLDKTGMGSGSYIVGGKCGRDGSFGAHYGPNAGRRYSVTRDVEGTYAITYPFEADRNAADVATLMSYLLGPRHVRMHVWRQGEVSFTDAELAKEDVTVHNGPDPDDRASWTSWVRGYAIGWHHGHPGERGAALYFAAADVDVAHLTGMFGHCSLGSATISAEGRLW